MAFHQLREHITAAIRGVEGPELSIIVDYHVRAAVANNNLVARSFLTEELGYKVMFLTGGGQGCPGTSIFATTKKCALIIHAIKICVSHFWQHSETSGPG